MQHPINKKTVAGPSAMAALCLLWMGLGTGRALAQAQDSAGPNVARVSFVQGSVQLLAGQGSDFQQAVMNMPALDGSRLQTGGDGQAEIEFGDGSVARLTPNSVLQFDHVGQDRVQLSQLSGLSYYEFNVGDGHPPFSVQFNNLYVQPTANSILRVGLDAGWEVAVFSGSVSVQGDGIPAVPVAENQSIRSSRTIAGLRTRWRRESIATPGITGIRTGTRRLPRRPPSRPRYAMTQPIRITKTGMIWTLTVTGIPSREPAMYGFPPASVRVGIRMDPATGPFIPPSATPGFQAIPGAGCPTTAVPGVIIPSAGDGLQAVAAVSGIQ